MPHPELRSERVALREFTPQDAPELLRVLSDPSVARWWGMYDEERVRREYTGRDDAAVFLIAAEGEIAGMIQYSEETEADYRHAGIDIALVSDKQGRGLGPEAIRVLARYLFEERGHHRLTIDPAAANENAIKAYGRVGFRPVGIMRQYERGTDGTWHDGLLMDMLAGELRGSPVTSSPP